MAKPKRATKKPKSKPRLWIGRIVKTLAILLAASLVAGTAAVVIAYRTTDLPDPNSEFQTNTTFVYYRDGKTKIGSFAIQNRQTIPYAQMPQNIKDAVIAAENRSFWEDPGISVRGLIRSAWVIARGGNLQGGSTITQQYIKIKYLTSEQLLTRKFKELLLATKISRQVPKEQILEGYLNTIYFGRGAYGIQAASRSYFNVDAKDLTDPQAAVLASVINNPSIFDPSVDEDNEARLLDRYRYVITSMAEMGKLTAAEATKFSKALPEFPEIPINSRYGGAKGFLMKMVENELAAAGFTPGQINGGGLQVVTTFDKESQDAAVKSAQKHTKKAAEAADKSAKNLHVAIASVDVGNGEVRALYGGPDFVKNSRNWATTPRPTASTFKPYALAAGLEQDFSLLSTFNGNTFTPRGSSTTVRNEFSYQYGRVNLVKATADSINTAFVDLTEQMKDGPKSVSKMAQKLGAENKTKQVWEDNPRIALGDAEVSPLGQATAYATFANNGNRVDSHVVREVKDIKGKVIYTAAPKEDKAISKDLSRDVTYALSSVVREGTGAGVQSLGRPIAGKTGTQGVKDEIKSAWFVAYTKQISTAVMYVAGDDGNQDLDPYRRPGDQTFFGGTYPAATWLDFMETATKGQDIKDFDEPAYVNRDKAPAPQQTWRPNPTRPQQTESKKSEPTKEPSKSSEPSPTEPTSKPTQSAKPTEAPQPTQSSKPTATSEPTKTKEPAEPTTKAPAPKPTATKPATTKPAAPKPTQTQEGSGGGGSGGSGGQRNSGSGGTPADANGGS